MGRAGHSGPGGLLAWCMIIRCLPASLPPWLPAWGLGPGSALWQSAQSSRQGCPCRNWGAGGEGVLQAPNLTASVWERKELWLGQRPRGLIHKTGRAGGPSHRRRKRPAAGRGCLFCLLQPAARPVSCGGAEPPGQVSLQDWGVGGPLSTPRGAPASPPSLADTHREAAAAAATARRGGPWSQSFPCRPGRRCPAWVRVGVQVPRQPRPRLPAPGSGRGVGLGFKGRGRGPVGEGA